MISGLEIGAEDYIRKPFNHKELLLRIRKILNRSNSSSSAPLIRSAALEINLARAEVRLENRKLNLTPVEYKLLEVLGKKIDWTLSWQVLLKEVWGYEDWEGGREMVKVNIRRLRKKIEPDPSQPVYLLTERGRGYRLARR